MKFVLSVKIIQTVIKMKAVFFTGCTAVFFLFNSCNNSTGPDEESIFVFETPVINGIIITNSDSPDEIGRWRNPQYPPGIRYSVGKYSTENNVETEVPHALPTILNIDHPFPNPTTDVVAIQYSLPVAAEVSVWIVKGRLPEEDPSGIKTGSGGVFVSPKNQIAAVIINNQSLTVGYYRVIFNGRVGDEYLPTGFYRIYLKADNHLLWKDILIARSKADLPPELKDKYFNVGKMK